MTNDKTSHASPDANRSIMKKFFFIVASFVCASMAAVWNGTSDVSWYSEDAQAFNLTTSEQLAGLAKLVNSGNTFEGKTITLGADLFLNDTTGIGDGTWSKKKLNAWTPIGTAANPFKGKFDGLAGTTKRKIYGLYVNSGSDYAGLFGFVSATTISNLDLLAGSVKGSNYVGSLVGKSLETNIANVHAEVPVSGKDYVGGIAGFGHSVSNSSHIGDVNGMDWVGGLAGVIDYGVSESHSIGNVKGDEYVGGLIGLDSVSVSSTVKTLLISKSYSQGTVMGDNVVGGLIGKLKKTSAIQIVLDSCYHNQGNVVGSYDFVGGLAGYAMASIKNSYSEADVSGHDYVGGLAGSADSIYNSYSIGRVEGRVDVGGLGGIIDGAVSKSYAKGDSVIGLLSVGGLLGCAKSEVDSSYAMTNVRGDSLVGGLVGLQYSGSITKSYALGNVAGTKKVGGLVGLFDGPRISKSYANGSVTGLYSKAKDAGNYIGGLVGYGKGTLEETYASGAVKGLETNSKFTGCLVGYVNGSMTISKSYYDATVCGLGVEGVDELGNERAVVNNTPAQTTAAMKTKSTFEQWNFVVDWDILKDSYPFLRYDAMSSSSVASSSSVVVSSSSAKSSSSSITSSSSVKSSSSVSSSSAKLSSSSQKVSSSSSSSSTVKSSSSVSSSSVKSSSSVSSSSAKSSSSVVAASSSSVKSSSSSQKQPVALEHVNALSFGLKVVGHELQITGGRIGSSFVLFDIQGRVLMDRKVNSSNFNVNILQSGIYIVRIDSMTKVVDIR